MIRRSHRRLSLEASTRLKKDVKKLLSDYDNNRSWLYYMIGDDSKSIYAPKFTKDQFRSIQQAFNEQDISYCMDVVEELRDVLKKIEIKRREVESAENQLDNVWSRFISELKSVSPDITAVDNHGDWVGIDSLERPFFYNGEIDEKGVEVVENLYNAIIDNLR